jgi:hypothetical protein
VPKTMAATVLPPFLFLSFMLPSFERSFTFFFFFLFEPSILYLVFVGGRMLIDTRLRFLKPLTVAWYQTLVLVFIMYMHILQQWHLTFSVMIQVILPSGSHS